MNIRSMIYDIAFVNKGLYPRSKSDIGTQGTLSTIFKGKNIELGEYSFREEAHELRINIMGIRFAFHGYPAKYNKAADMILGDHIALYSSGFFGIDAAEDIEKMINKGVDLLPLVDDIKNELKELIPMLYRFYIAV